ncbi:protease modulator HflC [Microvirga sp. W0021]|uniref:Protein HflC n=1 Tax=Hohaiivirga grylli TaxID=3133970 RepID=A0ABV0BK32_9HYPH
MRNSTIPGIALIALVILGFIGINSVYVVRQTEYALVLRFNAVRATATNPGLHFKMPFIDNVHFFEKRVMSLALPLQNILSIDRQYLDVDAFVRFQITDPLKFYQGATNMDRAKHLLTGFANSAMRQILASSSRDAIVRTNRSNLMKNIQDQMKMEAASIGVRIVDMRLTRVDLPTDNSKAVFERMVSERRREAADIRAQGDQKAQIIRAKAQRDATVIIAEANRQSQELRGQGDAEKNRILAEAFGQDAEFFNFIRSMQAYQAGFTADKTNMVLSPDSEFFRYFRDPKGGGKPATPKPVPAQPAPAAGQ